jgi:DNA topoisomerase I
MTQILVIVESPAKCSKIQKFLGSNFIVKASFGHICNLDKSKGLGAIDVNNNFKPKFINIVEKKKYIRELKKWNNKCSEVIIASDLDREGEAIGYHLINVLKLDINKTKRIVFNEITKTAITNAVKNPKLINMDLVHAQQSRQILDYLIGFEISPLLWHHVKNKNSKGSWLSAGRCQSPALRLIYDRNQNINNFKSSNFYELSGIFDNTLKINFICKCSEKIKQYSKVKSLLKEFKTCQFKISLINESISKSKPSAPYITSTIQQDLSNKMSLSPKVTMQRLQKLYEAGKITYMRTDSKIISEDCMGKIKDYILSNFNETYYSQRKYKNTSKNSQEAHECIRPVDVSIKELDDTFESIDKRIYSFIWKRTISSQMSEMRTKVLKIEISNNKNKIIFHTSFNKTEFLGYGKIYNMEIINEIDNIINKIHLHETISYQNIIAHEKLTKSCGRYTEASLIKELEKKGIGRPSTFSSIVSTLFKREYIVKDTREGKDIVLKIIKLENNSITDIEKTAKSFKENNKIFITDLGKIVIEFLLKHFNNILEYQYTSSMENNLDCIANGTLDKLSLLNTAYQSFHPIVQSLLVKKKEVDWETKNHKPVIGIHPVENKNIYCYKAKYGPVIQLGDDKPKYIAVPKDIDYKNITLDKSIYLLSFPKNIGKYNDKDIIINISKNGFYSQYNNKNYNLNDSNASLEDIILIIKEKEKSIIKEFSGNISIRKGPHGPYILRSGKYSKIVSVPYQKKTCPETVTLQECKDLLKNKKKYKK